MNVYIQIGIFCGAIPVFFFGYLISKQREARKRLEEYIQTENQKPTHSKNIKKLILKIIQPLLPSETVLEGMRVSLQRANLSKYNPEDIYLLRWASTLMVVVLMCILMYPDVQGMFIFAGCAGAFFYLLPPILIKRRIIARQKRAQNEVQDFIDLVANGIEAGLELNNSIDKVTRQIPGVLAEEFQIAFSEIALNRRRAQAFMALAERLDVEDVTLLIDAINQAEKTGVSMAKVLKDQVNRIRQNYKTNALKMAQAATIKMLAPLFFFILPALLIVVLGPPLIGIGKLLAF